MIYQVGPVQRKELFSSKDVPSFFSVTILLINGHKNTHPLKFVNQ